MLPSAWVNGERWAGLVVEDGSRCVEEDDGGAEQVDGGGAPQFFALDPCHKLPFKSRAGAMLGAAALCAPSSAGNAQPSVRVPLRNRAPTGNRRLGYGRCPVPCSCRRPLNDTVDLLHH